MLDRELSPDRFERMKYSMLPSMPVAYCCLTSLPDVACSGPPVSAFQRQIRGDSAVLRDHICKEMNDLNLERCRCIPKNVPGADWRVLQEIVAADPSRTNFKVNKIYLALVCGPLTKCSAEYLLCMTCHIRARAWSEAFLS